MRTHVCAAMFLFAVGVPAIAPPVVLAQAAPTGDPFQVRSLVLKAEDVALWPPGTRGTSLLAAIAPPEAQPRQAGREVTVEDLQRLALERNVALLAVREDIAVQESAKIALYEAYLPTQMNRGEV